MRGYWIDPDTKLMWTGKDNGKDVNWNDAVKYCRKLRLLGFSDWRLPSIGELRGIWDRNGSAPGTTGHVKGNLFLTAREWSATKRPDLQGRPSGNAYFFDFLNGIQNDEDATLLSGRFANNNRRALCVRASDK